MFYSPLRYSIYRIVWIATLVSNIGTWIHTVTSSLLMAKLTTSAPLIALIQTAAMTPIFIFSIPGGVIADYYDRKSIIIMAHIFMSATAISMAILTYTGYMTDWALLVSIFLLNIGLAFNQPAWQAISSTLVPKEEIKQSAALNNLSFNISRCFGPAIAGYFYSSLGPAYLFALNGISFIGVILAFCIKVESKTSINQQRSLALLLTSLQSGFGFFKEFPLFRFIISKSFCYFLFGSCVWALLPYIIVIHNQMSNHDLGLLISAAGIGAIFCASTICYLRKFLSDTLMTTFSLFVASFVIFSIGYIHSIILFFFLMFLFGFSWSLCVSVFNGILQAEFPLNTRSRLIGMYSIFFASAQALGSFLSGQLIQAIGLSYTMSLIASATLAIAFCYLLSASSYWQEPLNAN